MLKRIYAFCLILALTVSLITGLPVSAASGSEMQLIIDLGIIESFENTGLIPQSYTRGDFARSLCIMERSGEPAPVSEETASEYASDISDNKNCNFIVSVISRGYMNTDKEGMFNPEKSISLQDAVIALVKVLGYEQMAQKNGGTYEDYYAIALKTKILNNVVIANNSKLSINETAKILANAMNSRLLEPDNIYSNEDCLWDRWRIVTGKGKILANSNMGILTEKTRVNHINIDGTVYYTKLLIENELVGSNVTYYVLDRGMGDEVVSIFVNSYSETVTLKANEIASVSDTRDTLVIKTEDKNEIKMDKKGFLVINGTTKSPTMEFFNLFESGTATFVDTDSDGLYDVIHMTLLYQSIIEGINANSMTLATRYDKNIINFDRVDAYEVYLGKKSVPFANLKKGMTVGIACDKFEIKDGKIIFDFLNSEYIRIYASSRSNTGYVTSLSDETFELDDMKKLYGSAYKHLVKSGHIPELKSGDYITAYFDNFGCLSYYELSDSASSMKYGYLIAAGNQGVLNKTIQVKILEENGDFSIFDTGKTFILDGKRVNSGSGIYTVNENNDVNLNKRQLIRYRAVEGILKEIDTTVIRTNVERTENSLDAVLPFDTSVTTNIARKIRSGAVDRRYAFKSDCVIFVDEAPVDDDNPSVKQISVRTGSVSDGSYYISGYDSNIYNEISCVVRHDSYNEKEGDAKSSLPYHGYNCYVVKQVKPARRGEDEWGWNISLVGDSKEVIHFVSEENIKLYASKDAEDWGREQINVYKQDTDDFTDIIKKGDIIRFDKNSADDIVYIEKMFDFEDHKDLMTEVPEKGGQVYGFAQVEMVNDNNVLYGYGNTEEAPYVFRKRSVFTTVPLYHVSTGDIELMDISQIPSRGSGNDVKVFMRYYNYGIIYDHIFYIYD